MSLSDKKRKKVTFCFLLREGEILLGQRKTGFGVGKWNGVGGNVEEGEDILSSVVREIAEEIYVSVKEEHVEKVGEFLFYSTKKDGAILETEGHVYFIRQWEGEPKESDEIIPQWYRLEEIPFDVMWEDDFYWLPRALSGEKLRGTFWFHGEGKKMGDFEISSLDSF
jgi:ADP-ribose pyrophosphatase YjhB (NUDIX family)